MRSLTGYGRKPVIVTVKGVPRVFSSVRAASEFIGISQGNLSDVLNGKKKKLDYCDVRFLRGKNEKRRAY